MSDYDFDPYNIPDEYLNAVGLVVATAAQAEHVLQQFIGALLGIDNIQTLALATHMNFPLKDHIIRTLAELDAPNIKELDKIDNLLDAMSEALDKRNIIVHNSLAINPDTKEILSLRTKARGSLQLQLKPISVDEIEKDAAAIYKASMDIVSFMMSRGLSPHHRTKLLREPVNRGKKSRKEREDIK